MPTHRQITLSKNLMLIRLILDLTPTYLRLLLDSIFFVPLRTMGYTHDRA